MNAAIPNPAIPNAAVPEDELVGVVELLGFLAELCQDQHELLTAAYANLVGVPFVDAADLRAEIIDCADMLAQTMGFLDHTLDDHRVGPAR
jgi:hypothetical protein